MLYIAENLKVLRKSKNFTQEEVAEKLNVSPQSVSKWERGDTMPDITLLPALANLYKTSIDALIGMDKINDQQTRFEIFKKAHELLRNGDTEAAILVYTEALKTYPGDEWVMADLAMALALDDDPDKLNQAIDLCERVLSDNQGEKVHHTTRAALCFMYMKIGEKEKALATANKLPHTRESRETVIAQFNNDPTIEEINSYLKFIAIGESDEQDFIEIDFGIEMITVCTEFNLIEKIAALREEYNAPTCETGFKKIPLIRIRDKVNFAPKRVRVRHFADYLLDKEYDDAAAATEDIMETLRKLVRKG